MSGGLIRTLGPVRYCAVILRARGCCTWCGLRVRRDRQQVDHVTPRCDGGGASLDNLVLACAACNLDRRFAEVPERALALRTHRQVWRAVFRQLDIPLVRGEALWRAALVMARRRYPAQFAKNKRARAAWLEREAGKFEYGAAA